MPQEEEGDDRDARVSWAGDLPDWGAGMWYRS